MPRTAPAAATSIRDSLQPLTNPTVTLTLAVAVLAVAGNLAFQTYLGPFLAGAAGVDTAALATILAAAGVAGMLGGRASGTMTDRTTPASALMAASTGFAISWPHWAESGHFAPQRSSPWPPPVAYGPRSTRPTRGNPGTRSGHRGHRPVQHDHQMYRCSRCGCRGRARLCRLVSIRWAGALVAVEWVRLQLDLEAFDDAQFEPYLRRCQQSGVGFTTMADVGDTAECRRALYELNKTCAADIPERGEFYTFDEYLNNRIETPLYDPRGVVLAVSTGVWVGMAATSLRLAEGYAFSEMTGVLPSHRGQGISLAMKLLAIGFARSSGMRWLRTFHHPCNAAAIGMNRRLGFVNDNRD